MATLFVACTGPGSNGAETGDEPPASGSELVAGSGTSAMDTVTDPRLDGAYWRQQGLRDVLDPWTRNGQDPEGGAFFARMDRAWQPTGDHHKYPGMIARHLFSYSAAYLLTGDEAHLEMARRVFDFLVAHGWDPEYGGWYDEVDRHGNVVATTKDLFNQAYATTGVALYWIVTRDPAVRPYLDRSLEILEEHAWDTEHDGYVRSLNRDLSVGAWRKDFSPQIAHVSGYLAYLYPATRDPALLDRFERIMALVLDRAIDEETGWVVGRFDRQWRYDGPEPRRTNVGHDLETAWLLMRLHLLTGSPEPADHGLRLADAVLEHAFEPASGAWGHQLVLASGALHRDNTPWWVQAYGNMVQLYQYRLTDDPRHLETFLAGARFWDTAFMDPEHGAAYLSVHLDGEIHRGDKAVRTKTSYHSVEYALLSYLYLTLWVEGEQAELHYRIHPASGAERLYPSLLEDPGVRIAGVSIDGVAWSDYDPDDGSIRLPQSDEPLNVRVAFRAR